MSSDSENARTYYHYACDSLGSITHVIAGNEFGNGGTDGGADRRILCRYGYDAFGNTVNAEETITNRYGFTGEMHDDITDMYYLRARYYAPYTGRFTQADTYHGDGLNLYVYAGNNPVKYVDPSGHCSKENGVVSGSYSGKVWDYSKQFDGELVNFNDGYEIKNVVDKDLYLVQFHSDAKVGYGRSLKYWTTFDEANGISTIDDYMDKMALLSDWGARDNVSIAKIPAGTKIKYAIGTAKEQVGAIESRTDGAYKCYLKNLMTVVF